MPLRCLLSLLPLPAPAPASAFSVATMGKQRPTRDLAPVDRQEEGGHPAANGKGAAPTFSSPSSRQCFFGIISCTPFHRMRIAASYPFSITPPGDFSQRQHQACDARNVPTVRSEYGSCVRGHLPRGGGCVLQLPGWRVRPRRQSGHLRGAFACRLCYLSCSAAWDLHQIVLYSCMFVETSPSIGLLLDTAAAAVIFAVTIVTAAGLVCFSVT